MIHSTHYPPRSLAGRFASEYDDPATPKFSGIVPHRIRMARLSMADSGSDWSPFCSCVTWIHDEDSVSGVVSSVPHGIDDE